MRRKLCSPGEAGPSDEPMVAACPPTVHPLSTAGWEDVEDALPDATHLEEDAPVDVKLRALMADAASFGADADGIRDADFEAQDDAFLEVISPWEREYLLLNV